MKIRKLAAACLLICAALAAQAPKKVYPKRWFYVSRPLRSDRDLDQIRDLIRTAAAHGLNGMVYAGGLDRIDIQPPEFLERLKQMKAECDRAGIEIIPTGFNVGYGGALLAHDRNLAEGLPVKGALFVARKGEARFQSDAPPKLANGSFETHKGDAATGYTSQDAPGKLTFIDTQVAHSGKASLRFENFGTNPEGASRIEQSIAVRPYRSYRVRAWIRTEGAEPATLFSIRAYTPDKKRNYSWFEPELKATAGWHEVTAGFNSWGADRLTLSIGVEEGKSGKLWLDDVRIEEVGLVDVVRREGTPVRVRGEKNGTVYEEGRDYAPISDPKLSFRFDHESPAIRLAPGSRIREGERLRVDYYHGATIYRDQTPACMSEPKVMEIWSRQFPLIEKYLAPKTYLLALDEVRMGGTCEACRRHNISMAERLGQYATKLHGMIRKGNPAAEIFVWSDMFDPNHNAHGDYYLVDGDYTGSWNYLPKDMQIACWYFERRDKSLEHFSKLGLNTLAAAYYDADDLSNPQGWLESLDQTPGAVGIMYTTWYGKYKLLAPFGDLVNRR
ncbi:MAG: hypothetical protein ACM336_00490 [Acidobacteriota bacterium]